MPDFLTIPYNSLSHPWPHPIMITRMWRWQTQMKQCNHFPNGAIKTDGPPGLLSSEPSASSWLQRLRNLQWMCLISYLNAKPDGTNSANSFPPVLTNVRPSNGLRTLGHYGAIRFRKQTRLLDEKGRSWFWMQRILQFNVYWLQLALNALTL